MVVVRPGSALCVGLLLAAILTAARPVSVPAQTALVMAFVPSVESRTESQSIKRLTDLLSLATGYRIESFTATSYTAMIEAMAAGRADIGWLSALSYVLAHDRDGVEVRLVTVRFGLPYYKAEIIAQASSGIHGLADLRGKRFAFVDPASAAGYLFPMAGLKKAGFELMGFFAQTVFAGSHNNVVIDVYQGQVDAGAVFDDARVTVQTMLPDVMQKVKVIWTSQPIPNDTVSMRRGLPSEVKDKVTTALLQFSQTPSGSDTLKSLYNIDALANYQLLVTMYGMHVPNLNAFFDPVRDIVRYAGAAP